MNTKYIFPFFILASFLLSSCGGGSSSSGGDGGTPLFHKHKCYVSKMVDGNEKWINNCSYTVVVATRWITPYDNRLFFGLGKDKPGATSDGHSNIGVKVVEICKYPKYPIFHPDRLEISGCKVKSAHDPSPRFDGYPL